MEEIYDAEFYASNGNGWVVISAAVVTKKGDLYYAQAEDFPGALGSADTPEDAVHALRKYISTNKIPRKIYLEDMPVIRPWI